VGQGSVSKVFSAFSDIRMGARHPLSCRRRRMKRCGVGTKILSFYDRAGAADQPRQLLEAAADAVGHEIDHAFHVEHRMAKHPKKDQRMAAPVE
jgi:hypothetical protein